MKSLSIRSLGTLAVAATALAASLSLMPGIASALVVNVTTVTATSSNAVTTSAKLGDTVNYQLTLDATPWVSPQINVFNLGSTTMQGSGSSYWYSTTTNSINAWSQGAITFYMSVGSTTIATVGTTTVSQANLTGSNVTYDTIAPAVPTTLDLAAADDTGSSATDNITSNTSGLTITGTKDAGSSVGVTDSVGGYLGGVAADGTTAWTLDVSLAAGAHSVTATSTDVAGNVSAASSALAITVDTTAPANPTGLSDTTFSDPITVSLASTGSSQIRYTTDGTTPDCSTGSVYSSAITVSGAFTLKAVGCDEAGNLSSVVTAVYTYAGSNSSGGGGGGSYHPPVTPAVPATHLVGCVPGSGDLFDITSGKSCTVRATPAIPASHSSGLATGGAGHVFTSYLTSGSLGSEVKALQEFLNSHGYTIANSGAGSPGNETTKFGGLTKAALIKYQKAKGITPAVGYFGPKTRAAINAEQ